MTGWRTAQTSNELPADEKWCRPRFSPEAGEPIDVVYTWVDDSLPGHCQSLHEHARTAHDLSPNRTRDNLDVLRYSLRSVEQFAPWVRNV